MRIPEIDKLFNKRHKKASLSLSTNAIVVLVLAISMLGLGLAFTKSMFKKFGEKLTVPPPDIPATKDEPVVLPSDDMEIRHGEEFVFQVNYYNDYGTGYIVPAMECTEDLVPTTTASTGITTANSGACTATSGPCDVVVAPQKVEAGQQKSFKFIIPKEATADLTGKLDVCQVKFCSSTPPASTPPASTDTYTCNTPDNEDSKQVTLRIT